MLKLTRTYNDYNGVSRTEDFYFNLTQAEVTELELSVDGGLVEMINRIVAAQDGKQIIAIFKDIILRAYGEKSPDGKRYIKNQELRDGGVQRSVHGAGHRCGSGGPVHQRHRPPGQEGSGSSGIRLTGEIRDAGTCDTGDRAV